MSIESVMLSNHIILGHPLLLLPSVFPSISLFQWVGSSPKCWRFTFNISPFNNYSGLISFKIDWFDLAVQGTLQESSLTPQFENIISLVPILPYGPALTFMQDYWKNRSFDCCCCWVTSVVSDSVWPHRWKPTRLPRPWDSPGKNTGVGCHFLLQCVKVKSEVAQSCPTLSDPLDWSLPGSSVHGIFQAKSTGVGCHCLLRSFDYTDLYQQIWN